jgi:hypothetical protein
MQQVALLLRSYADDFHYAKRLVESFRAHNIGGLTLYIVVSEDDLELFNEFTSSYVQVLSDTHFGPYFTTTDVAGIRPGYVNQEIVKLAFWELGLTESYFCVDSDAVFIRDFDESDFMASDGYPFSVLVEDKELKVESRYYTEHWVSRDESLRRIADEVGLEEDVLLTCHGHQVFSSRVLQGFRDRFLAPRGWNYLDALRVSPYEFSWYNFWLQVDRSIPIHQREPLVKVFHHEGHHMEYLVRGVTLDDLARGYIAVVVNSNYSRDLGLVPLNESREETLARYLSYPSVLRLLRAKMKRSLQRRI